MSKDDATWLRICYVIFAIIVAYSAWKAGETIGIQTGWSERYSEWYPLAEMVGSVAIGALSVWYLRHDEERRSYFLASIAELRKVTWPNFVDTRRMTIVVCIVVGIFSAILAVFDFLWASLLQALLA